jgi:nitroreductase
MAREALTAYPVHELIRKRWSPRAFEDRSVDDGMLRQIFEAASWSFSASNRQPWRYFYGLQGSPVYSALLQCLNPSNRVWAEKAPVLILSVALSVDDEGKENGYAFHDAGAANALLSLEAAANGLAAHPMGGFDESQAKNLFQLRDGADPVVILALGYPGDSSLLPEKLRERETLPRTRKKLDDIISNILP